MSNEIEYIDWIDSAHWSCKLSLGSKNVYYNFQANWNSRDESWAVTITDLDGVVLIQNRKMVLNVDLLANCYVQSKPSCILYPYSENKMIHRITKDNMINGEVRLAHIKLGA